MFWIAAVGMCLATIPHAMFYGAIGGILARAFPTRVRYSGLSLAYQLCSLLVGGGTPVLAQWILNSTGSINGVAIASASYAIVSLVCTLALLRITGFRASDLSSAERADAEEFQGRGADSAGQQEQPDQPEPQRALA
ncbi:proline/glycine betaine transporter [compost metagenome]